jgi:hypothetical protein
VTVFLSCLLNFVRFCTEDVGKVSRSGGGGDVIDDGWKKAALNRSRQSGRQ